MPVDENGNRADIVVYGGSTIGRMNMGRLYEHFINAARRDLEHRLRREAGFIHDVPPTAYQIAQFCQDEAAVKRTFDTAMRFYAIVAPLMHKFLEEGGDPAEHVASILRDGMYLYMPPDNPVDFLEMGRQLRDSEFCPHYGPVTYTDGAGNTHVTKNNVLIGGQYYLMLEKTGDDWSGVASVKVQHFGVPAKLNNFDKQTSPGRQQSVRGLGESETRSYVCTVGPKATAKMLGLSNNPAAHREATRNIITADQPTNIETVVGPEITQSGAHRPVSLVFHLAQCRGFTYVYQPVDGTIEESM